jgi:transcriptional regulator with XRE-family HTH domain/quercetin dioxygenase-like cupin family protein
VSRGGGNGGGPEYGEMGDRLREARQTRGMSLRALAERLGVSPSLISQVETGRAKPSVSTLYAIVSELGISLDELLFTDARPAGWNRRVEPAGDASDRPMPADPVQAAVGRKTIRLASGVTWERLTTASMPSVDFLYVTYEVGGASSPPDAFQRHAGQEWGYIISGELAVTIAFDEYRLGSGDAIAFDSRVPHRLFNAGSEPVHAVWFVMGRRSIDTDGAPRPPGSEPSGP